MAFSIKVKVDDKPKGTRKIDVDITQDGKPFYSVNHIWTGIKDKDEDRFNGIIGELMGAVGIMPTGDGVIGPIEEDEMLVFEIGMTKASKRLNQWAVEDADIKGRDATKAKAALAAL